MFSVAFAQQ